MLFLRPSAFLALVVIVAPILIHLLVHRRARRLSFPTLRFIQPTLLASMRRRMLDDVALLTVRVAILVAAIAALAAPLVVTAARQREWNARVVRAAVVARGFQPSGGGARPFRFRDFEGDDLRDGILRAVAWLDAAPAARREIVVSSAFQIGSLTGADIAAVPASIGLRFERRGALPPSRTVADASLLTRDALISSELTLAGGRTSVRETRVAGRTSFPVEIEAPPDAKPAIDAATAAVLSRRVWAPPADRRARLIVIGPVARPLPPTLQGAPLDIPWMADAIARMSRDGELQTAASGATTGLRDARFKTGPWRAVATAADGTPLITAAGPASELIVASAASAFDLVTPLLLRSIVNNLAVVPDLRQAEVVSIADAELQRWSRPAPAPAAPQLNTIEDDDRRWFWAAALCLLALEALMRRTRAVRLETGVLNEEAARVA